MTRPPTPVALAALLGIACAGLSACAPDAALLARSASLPPASVAPGIKRVVGPVSGLVCNDRYDPTKAQAEALKQLRASALEHGADGVTGVQFTLVTNARSPCWHGVEATGLAVVYAR